MTDHFSQGGKIYADFTFLPDQNETGVEFRWINPLNKREQTYFELVKSSGTAQEKNRALLAAFTTIIT